MELFHSVNYKIIDHVLLIYRLRLTTQRMFVFQTALISREVEMLTGDYYGPFSGLGAF